MKKVLLDIKKNPAICLIPLLLTILVFRKYILYGLLPIPADIFPGLYFPWFDYKWGYHTPVPVQNAAISDVVSILYPWRILAFRYLKQGILPFWDPTILLGVPLLANFQSAVLNPINILFFVLPEYHAWSLGVILQPILAILFTYLFLKDLDLGKYPALFGSILYAYSGYSIVWMEYNSINYTVALFPLILLASSKIAKRIDWKWFLILSLCIAFQIFAGYPQNVIYTIIVSGIYFFYLLKGKRNNISNKLRTTKSFWSVSEESFLCRLRSFVLLRMTNSTNKRKHDFYICRTLLWLAAIILGLSLSAIQLLPSLELQALSIRNFDKVALAGDVKYLPIQNFVTILFPDYFGNPGRWNYWGSGSYDNFAFTISPIGIYFSIVAALFLKKLKGIKDIKTHFNFFLALTFFVFVFSVKNPISEAISNVKILGFVSSSNARMLFAATFSFSVVSAFGLQLVMSRKLRNWKVILPALIFLIPSLLLILDLFFVSGFSFGRFYYLIANKTLPPNEQVGRLVIAFRNTILPTGLVIITAASILLKRKYVSGAVIVVCLFVSIINASDKYLPFVKKDLISPSTEVTNYLIDHLGNTRFEKENNNLIFPSNSWSLYNLSTATGQDASGLLSTSRYLSIINFKRINDNIISRYNSISDLNSPLLNTLNISHYTAINWLNDSPDSVGKPNTWLIPESFKEVENIKTVRIYENEDNLGLAWIPKRVLCETNENAIYQKIALPDYDPADMVYVDCGEDKFEGSGSVEVNENKANDMRLTVYSDNESYLVLSSAYYPGWKVSIDGGRGKDVNKANSALLAVRAPAGEHVVKVYYDPHSFKIGAVISAISFLVWLMIFVKIRKLNIKH